MNHRLTLLLSAGIGIGLIGLAVISSLLQTRQALLALRQLDIQTAATLARRAQPVSHALNLVTMGAFKSVKAWDQGLSLITELPVITTEWSPFGQVDEVAGNQPASPAVTTLLTRGVTLSQVASQSWLLRLVAPQTVKSLATLSADGEILNQALVSGNHTYLLVFQNSDEVRATGGFMGSYATVKLKDGQIADLTIQDIYQPDGQFTGYVEAPPGVKEYLSSGKGIRLPDANWWPDFPSSAQKMLPFFGLGQETAIEGVVAVNLSVAEKLLQVTGPVFLPDYQTTVTAENIAQVARADRSQFFPGSQSKPHFLSSLFNQLKFKLDDLTPEQKAELFKHVLTSLKTKNIQLYSNRPELQELFNDHQLSGQTTAQVNRQPVDLALFLVESNVGINKANRGLQRQVKLTASDYRTQVEITFTNTNHSPSAPASPPSSTPGTGPAEANHLHYLNYQRILVTPQTEVKTISLQGKSVETWDEAIITTHTGEQLKQVGFLVEVPEQSTRVLSFELNHPPVGDHPQIWLQKQSGLPPTPYTVNFNNQTKDILLEKDELLQF
jgi:hypothetical protein